MKSLLKGGVLVFAATLVWQFSNFAFNIVGAHELGPEKYGILAAAIGLSYLLNPVVLAVQTVASRESTSVMVDEQGSQIRAIVNYYLLRLGAAAVAVAAVVMALSPLISDALHLDSALLVVIFGLIIPTLVATAIVRGVHQGTRRFERYSLGTVTEGLTKIGCAVAFLVLLWKTPIGGMLALLFSALAALAVNVALLRHFPKPTSAARPVRHPIRYSLTTFAVFGLQAILLSIDTITARLTLPMHVAGVYAGISLAGKMAYFATTALTAFLFPIFSSRVDQGLDTRRLLALSMVLVATICAAVVAVFAWAPYLVTTLLLGSEYRSIAHDIRIMGVIFSIYAMTSLLVTYLLARRQRGIVPALLLAVAVQIGGFAAFHRSPTDLMAVQAAAFTVALLSCGALGLLGFARRTLWADALATPLLEEVTVSRYQPVQAGRHRAGRAPRASAAGQLPGIHHVARRSTGRHRTGGDRRPGRAGARSGAHFGTAGAGLGTGPAVGGGL
jgi:O-antigen/teichoic acid export membrane protein